MILSVLDQTPIAAGSSPAAALANSIDLARHCEALGYHRYWLAEHHASPALAGSAPEILIGAVAAATSRMRIGSGGIMLPHYSPLKVAEQFSLLAGLYPDRIDLGQTPTEVRSILAASLGLCEPEEHPDLDTLLARFDPSTVPTTPWSIPAEAIGQPDIGLRSPPS